MFVNLSIQVLVECLLLAYHNCHQLLFDQLYFEAFVIDLLNYLSNYPKPKNSNESVVTPTLCITVLGFHY